MKSWARTIKRDVHALYLAARDPRTPWYAKALALGIAAYALSPIDLIPDFIPVVGYLDEIILLPLAIMLAVRLREGIGVSELSQHGLIRAQEAVGRQLLDRGMWDLGRIVLTQRGRLLADAVVRDLVA